MCVFVTGGNGGAVRKRVRRERERGRVGRGGDETCCSEKMQRAVRSVGQSVSQFGRSFPCKRQASHTEREGWQPDWGGGKPQW